MLIAKWCILVKYHFPYTLFIHYYLFWLIHTILLLMCLTAFQDLQGFHVLLLL